MKAVRDFTKMLMSPEEYVVLRAVMYLVGKPIINYLYSHGLWDWVWY